jgi:hypothetical protein
MSSEHGGGEDRRPKKLIYEAKEYAHRARQQVNSDGIEYGNMPVSDKRLLAKAALKYWDVLHEFRDESVLSEGEVPDISPVRSRVGRTTERFVESNEIGGDFDIKQVPAVDELNGQYLYELTKAFDDVASTLGFGASATSGGMNQYHISVGRDSSDYDEPWRGGTPKPDSPQREFYQSELYHRWYNSVASGDPNDYVIALTAHPGYTQTSGTGKTTLAGALAKEYFDLTDGYDAENQFTVDAGYLSDTVYPETEKGSCIIGDEMQGTVANANLNSKRAMSSDAIESYAAIAGGRKDRKTVILVFQTLARINKDLFDFVDSWLLIVDDVEYRCNHYAVVPEVFNLGSNELKTPGIETLSWDPLPKSDEDYQIMEEKKDAANRGEREQAAEDDEDEYTKAQQIEIAQDLRDDGMTLEAIKEKPYIDYSREWVRQNTVAKDEKESQEGGAS